MARLGIHYVQPPGASLELAHLVAETGRRPGVVIVADLQVFPKFLEPQFGDVRVSYLATQGMLIRNGWTRWRAST